MAGVRKRRSSTRASEPETTPRPIKPDVVPLSIFAFLMAAAPLAFGTVDQPVQVVLLGIFAVGLAIYPPAILRLSRTLNALLIALVALLVLKEFAPAAIFGKTLWRLSLTRDYALPLTWMHHPEPGRAVDGLFACAIAVLWLLWVRTLAGKRENRPWIVWALAGSAALVALVSFLVKTKDPTMIFGLRYTTNWRGFGPFPNRNHTASFLAMGAVMSCGGVVWSMCRKSYILAGGTVIMAVLSVAGIFATQSRGGLLALSVGLTIYATLCMVKFRNRRVAALVVAGALLIASGVLVSGAHSLQRFTNADAAVSNDTRREVWKNALVMWRDAPLFGHGMGTFPSVFPMYQAIRLDNQKVLHPESSWLQWLTELGLVPVGLAVAVTGVIVLNNGRRALKSRNTFFLYAAAFGAVGALLCHCAVDVPGHRWATAAFGLAALGFSCPRLKKPNPAELEWHVHHPSPSIARRAAVVPLAAAIFYALPVWGTWPAWSPALLNRWLLATREPLWIRMGGYQTELKHFPLNASLHQALGMVLMRLGAPVEEWQSHFRIASRLTPGSWSVPIEQARACGSRWPQFAFNYWQVAIERAGSRSFELFINARDETARLPHSSEIWGAYVEANPYLALEYALGLPRENARPYFESWWRQRALTRTVELTPREVKSFYALAPLFSSPGNFSRFMQERPALVADDYVPCARVLYTWGEDDRAWHLLSTKIHEPDLPSPIVGVDPDELEHRLTLTPESVGSAQALAAACIAQGDKKRAFEVIYDFAKRADAPPFFTRKAAYLLYAQHRIHEAVGMMLKESGAVEGG